MNQRQKNYILLSLWRLLFFLHNFIVTAFRCTFAVSFGFPKSNTLVQIVDDFCTQLDIVSHNLFVARNAINIADTSR